MSKQGVIGITLRDMLNVLPIKKHLLLFDKLIVAEETLNMSRQLVELISRVKGIDRTLYNYNNDTIEQLINEGLLEFSKTTDPIIGEATAIVVPVNRYLSFPIYFIEYAVLNSYFPEPTFTTTYSFSLPTTRKFFDAVSG
jgi:hypothetical protein